MRSLLFLLIPSLCLAGSLRATDGRFVDDSGATIILRGVDVAGDSKVPPFEPAQPAVFDPLPGWGVNVARLLFTWEAYEPQPGQYDASYLAYYKTAVEAAWAHGIYVLVDFHQDAFSRFSIGGCGEGFPKWALPPGVTPAVPDNGAACANWGSRELGDSDVQTSFDAFYADSNGARTRYLAMVGSVAAALAAEPGVLGYDLLNEPFGDEPTQISPLYEDAAPVIRAADPTAILFLSPAVLTSAGRQTELTRPTFDNIAYSPHYYDPGLVLFHGWSGTEPDEPFMFMSGVAQSWSAPLFLGEFGAPPSTDELLPYMDTMHRHLNAVLGSCAQWAYTPGWTPANKDGWNTEDDSIVDDAGALRANFQVRPYAQRIAGTPTTMTVMGDELSLEWQNDPAAGDTQIFAPAGHVEAGSGVGCSRQGSLVTCHASAAGAKSVRITKSAPNCGLTGAEVLLLYFLLSRRASSQRRPKRVSGSR